MGFISDLIRVGSDWPFGTFVVGLLLISFSLVAGLVIWGVLTALDSWFLPRQDGEGRVIGKKFDRSHVELIPVSTGNTSTIIPVHHGDEWSLHIQVGDQDDWIGVTEECYSETKKQDRVKVTYVIGRISGSLYVRDIE